LLKIKNHWIKYQPKLPDELKSDLATHFFYVFMRFEYTLKASNYYKGKINEKVEPDWENWKVYSKIHLLINSKMQ